MRNGAALSLSWAAAEGGVPLDCRKFGIHWHATASRLAAKHIYKPRLVSTTLQYCQSLTMCLVSVAIRHVIWRMSGRVTCASAKVSLWSEAMKLRFSIFVGISIVAMTLTAEVAFADTWMLRKTVKGECRVEETTAGLKMNPEDFAGPFAAKEDACKAASEKYDDTLTNPKLCISYQEGTILGCQPFVKLH